MLFFLSLSPRRPRALLRNVAERNIRATDRMDPSRVNKKTNRKSPTNKLQTVGNVCPMCALMMCFFFLRCNITAPSDAKSQRRGENNFTRGIKFSGPTSTFQTRRTTDKLHRCIFCMFESALDSFSVGAASAPPSTLLWQLATGGAVSTQRNSRMESCGFGKGHWSLARCSVGHMVTGSTAIALKHWKLEI